MCVCVVCVSVHDVRTQSDNNRLPIRSETLSRINSSNQLCRGVNLQMTSRTRPPPPYMGQLIYRALVKVMQWCNGDGV